MGITKKLVMTAFAMLVFCAASFASQISVQILQFDETRQEISDKSYDIETFVLDGFFESNYIVTNSDAAVISSEDDSEALWKSGIKEAFSGSSDYFVQIEVFYLADMNARNPVGMIDKINWKLAAVKNGNVINSESISEIKLKPNGQEDLGAIASNLVKNINKAIKA